MHNIRMNKDVLLSIVKRNREIHIKEYKEAAIEFRKQAIEKLEYELNDAKSGKTFKLAINLLNPVSFEQSYNTAIRKLELSLDTEIELDDDQFSQLVEDEWTWKTHFNTATSAYNNRL